MKLIDKFEKDKWFFVAVVLSDNTATLYVVDDVGNWEDGEEGYDGDKILDKGKRQLGTNPVMIGMFDNDPFGDPPRTITYFTGAIDSFIVWDATLMSEFGNQEKVIKDIFLFSADPAYMFKLNTDLTQFGREAVIDYGNLKIQGDDETLYKVDLKEFDYNAETGKYFITVPKGYEFYTLGIKKDGYDDYLEDFHVSELQEYIGPPEKTFAVESGKWTPQLAPVNVTGVTQNSVSFEWTPPAWCGSFLII